MVKEGPDKVYYFPQGGGEMGMLTRAFDWSQTPLGAPDKWPESLRITVAMILASRFPMFLWWGEDLIQFYNDAYRPSLGNDGKHPQALGQRGEDCWPEIWDIIYPLIRQVLTTAEATWSEDQLVPIYRNGKIEDVYWTFGYSPIISESRKVEGVLVVCTETTEKVTYLKELIEKKDELHFAIEATELGTWDLNPVTNRFAANDRVKEWFGLQPDEEIELSLAIKVMSENDRPRVVEAIQHALDYNSGGHYDIEYTIVHPITKIERIVRAKGMALFNDENVAYRFNGTLQDITEQKKARQKIEELVTERTKELALANDNLQKSNSELAQFAYIASHDLQEPLRKVTTFANLLEDSLNDVALSKRYLDKITTASSRMHLLIKDVLTYSQLSNEQEIFTEVNLQSVIENIKNDFELLIEKKGAQIHYTDMPTIEAIPIQMIQLFGNLISNSLKFSRADVKPVIEITASILPKESLNKKCQ